MSNSEKLKNGWRNKKNIKEKVQLLFETGMWNDCEFIFGESPNKRVFKGHKLILALASPVFEAMFYGLLGKKDTVAIRDEDPEHFQIILRYIYTGEIVFASFEEACYILLGGRKYLLPHLVEECVAYLSSTLNPSNACEYYEFANYFEETTLKAKCLEIFRKETSAVLNGISFEEADLSTVITIFEQNELNIESEMDLFSALERYSQKHGSAYDINSTGGPTYLEALKKIRFLTLTDQQFLEGPFCSSLLTSEQKCSLIMKRNCKNDNDVDMPSGFSNSISRRNIINHYEELQLGTEPAQPHQKENPDVLECPVWNLLDVFGGSSTKSDSDSWLEKLDSTNECANIVEKTREIYPCTKCGRVITSRIGLWSHMRTHKKSSDTQTTAKQQTSSGLTSLVSEPKTKVFPCTVCGRVITSQIGLWSHMRTHEKPSESQNTAKQQTSSELKTLVFEQKEKVFPCTVCGRVITSQIGLWSHMRTHQNKEQLQITEIQRPSSRQPSFTSKPTQQLFPCTVCGRVISSQIGLWSHMRTHTTTNESQYTPRSQSNLRQQSSSGRHDNKYWPCSVCGRVITSQIGLWSHMRTHQ